jgi:hypothetical protein
VSTRWVDRTGSTSLQPTARDDPRHMKNSPRQSSPSQAQIHSPSDLSSSKTPTRYSPSHGDDRVSRSDNPRQLQHDLCMHPIARESSWAFCPPSARAWPIVVSFNTRHRILDDERW